MSQEIIRSEYERSIDRVRGRRDRAYQIARTSGIMFVIFATVTIFIQSRGGEIHAFPRFAFIAGFAILTVFGIVLPVFFAYILREPPWELSGYSFGLPSRGEIAGDHLCALMILCTRENRRTVRRFERLMERVVFPEVSLGVLMILAAVVRLYL